MSLQDSDSIKNKRALLVTAGAEKHTLGLEMINTYLRAQGVDALYLGSDLPLRSLDKVIDDFDPNYIFISVTIRENMNSLEYLVDHFVDKYKDKIKISIGGQGLTASNKFQEMSNVYILNDIHDVRDFIEKE